MSNARRLVHLSWGLVLRVVVAAYTANLAAILSRVSIDLPYSSIDECIDGRCHFCTTHHVPTNKALKLYYPNLNVKYNDTWGGEQHLWGNLANETHPLKPKCDATWTYRFAGYQFQTFYAEAPCDVNIVGGQLFSMPLGLPINPEYASSFNYHVLKLVNEGVWDHLKKQYEPAQQCDWKFDSKAFTEAASTELQLGPLSFAGPTILIFVFIGMAFCQQMCANEYAAADLDGDGIVTAEELTARKARLKDACRTAADLDGDGRVSAREMISVITRARPRFRSMPPRARAAAQTSTAAKGSAPLPDIRHNLPTTNAIDGDPLRL